MTRGRTAVKTREDVRKAVQAAVERGRAKSTINDGVNLLLFEFYRTLDEDQQPPIAREAKQFGVAINTIKSWREKYNRDEK